MRESRRWGGAIACGLLFACAFPPVDCGALAFVALVPLLLAITGTSRRTAFGLAWLAGTIGCTLAVGASIFVAARGYFAGDLPTALALAVVLPQVHGALPIALFGLGARAALTARRLPLVALVGLPSTWVATEMLRARLGWGMPWILLAHAEHARPWLLQVADLGGAAAVSWVVALVNAGVALALRRDASWRTRGVLAAAVGAVVGAVYAYGGYALARWADAPGTNLVVAVVQPAVPEAWRTSLADASRVAERLRSLTRETAAHHPDLVVWPENAVAIPIDANPGIAAGAANVLAPAARVLLGGPRVETAGGRAAVRNAATLVDRDGAVQAVYEKRRLTPFGEYVPACLRPFTSARDVYVPAAGSGVLALDTHRLGVTICAEAIDAALVRADVHAGAELLVNLAHDGWFVDAAARAQHFHAAQLRAVENRRALVRATSDGVSAIVDPRGVPLAVAPVGVASTLAATVPLIDATTLYTRVGDVFGWACVLVAVATLAI